MLTNEEKLNSPQRLYLFYRDDAFYPLQIPEATLEDNIKANPGTIRVDDFHSGCVWTAADGWLNSQRKEGGEG